MSKKKLGDSIAQNQPPFAVLLGVKIVAATPDHIEGEMLVTPNHLNRNGVVHGGAIMAFADSVGGAGAFLHLAEGQGTTTIESKTNFLRAVRAGDTIRAISVPLHLGRKTMVWQTTLQRADGKIAAVITQTQMILEDA